MDSEVRRLERQGDEVRLARARLRAGLCSAPALGDFIRARSNALALELFEQVASRTNASHVFLDGPTGTGKTLLLAALAALRADAWLWSGRDLEERAARAIEAGALLDLPRLLVVDDLTRFSPELGALLARSLGGRSLRGQTLGGQTLVAAGAGVRDACASLGGRLAVLGPLEEDVRRELLARALSRLGAPGAGPETLPGSGFEILGLARNLALRATT